MHLVLKPEIDSTHLLSWCGYDQHQCCHSRCIIAEFLERCRADALGAVLDIQNSELTSFGQDIRMHAPWTIVIIWLNSKQGFCWLCCLDHWRSPRGLVMSNCSRQHNHITPLKINQHLNLQEFIIVFIILKFQQLLLDGLNHCTDPQSGSANRGV